MDKTECDQCRIHRELKSKTNEGRLAGGLSQVNFGKSSCVNWVSYLYYLLEAVSFLLTESGGEEVPPHCAMQPDVSVNYPEYWTSKQLVPW